MEKLHLYFITEVDCLYVEIIHLKQNLESLCVKILPSTNKSNLQVTEELGSQKTLRIFGWLFEYDNLFFFFYQKQEDLRTSFNTERIDSLL